MINLEGNGENTELEFESEAGVQDLEFEGTVSSVININSETGDYNELENKPAINGHTLKSGENTLDDIGVTGLIDSKVGNIVVLLETI